MLLPNSAQGAWKHRISAKVRLQVPTNSAEEPKKSGRHEYRPFLSRIIHDPDVAPACAADTGPKSRRSRPGHESSRPRAHETADPAIDCGFSGKDQLLTNSLFF